MRNGNEMLLRAVLNLTFIHYSGILELPVHQTLIVAIEATVPREPTVTCGRHADSSFSSSQKLMQPRC